MASLSTCHLELVVWDGNLVKYVGYVTVNVSIYQYEEQHQMLSICSIQRHCKKDRI